MTFIIILVALLLERFFHWHHLRHWRWFTSYERSLSRRMQALPAGLTLIVILLPPLFILGVLQPVLARWWSLQFIFSGIVLLYCLGPDNLWVQAYGCLQALTKEEPAAMDHAQAAFGSMATDNLQAFHQAFVRAIFVAFHQRIFAVLFWFALLGPSGALLYRMIVSVSTQAVAAAKPADQVKKVLDWLPVRLEAFLFALGGHFTAVLACWRRGFFGGWQRNDQFLGECGVAALDVLAGNRLPEAGVAEQAALGLIDRVAVIGLVILAVMVLLC